MTNRKKPIIIAGFPGVGKTYMTKYLNDKGYQTYDLDSKVFRKTNDFKSRYCKKLYQLINHSRIQYDVIFISTHIEVLETLALTCKLQNLVIVYPDDNSKLEWIKRLKNRGDSESFLDLIESKYSYFIKCLDSLQDSILNRTFMNYEVKFLRLKENQYLSDLNLFDNLLSKKPSLLDRAKLLINKLFY